MVPPTRHSALRGAARAGRNPRPERSLESAHANPTILRLLIPAGVAALTATAFLPALRNGFVNWDDDKVVLENEHVHGLGWPNLHWMFTAYRLGHYHPLTWLSLAIDVRIWGLTEHSAFGFHLTNVILHAVNAIWVYLLARRLLSLVANDDPPAGHRRLPVVAALTALLFGLHPLRVESVAWITERRDVLSAFFLLPCVLAYLRYAHGGRWGWVWYGLSVLLLALSLLCKAWGITLPVVLLLLDWYPLRRWSRAAALRLTLEKVPFAALAAWAGYHAVLAQSSAAYTMKTLAEYGWLARVAQGFYGVAFYLWKTLIPSGLIPIYEIPRAMNPLSPCFLGAAAVVSAITLLVLAYRRRWPAGLALWACYVVIVSPVLGLTQSGPQLVADRYSYLSCLPWALLVGAAVRRWTVRPMWRMPATLLALAALAGLGTLTWRQTQVWRDSVTLWEHTLRIAPRTYLAHHNLGVARQQRGEMARAEQHYRTALEINPDGADALANLGGLLSDRGQYAEALPLLERALAINAHQPRTWLNLAVTLEHLQRYAEAERHYRQGLQMEAPAAQRARLYVGLGATLAKQGRLAEAIECFRKATTLALHDDLAHYNLGLALQQAGQLDGAREALQIAVQIAESTLQTKPHALVRTRAVDALLALAQVHGRRGELEPARSCYQRVLELEPREPRATAALRRLMASDTLPTSYPAPSPGAGLP